MAPGSPRVEFECENAFIFVTNEVSACTSRALSDITRFVNCDGELITLAVSFPFRTADNKINATYVTVFNNYKTREGIEDSINGYAYIPDITDPGKLLVSLDGVLIDSPCELT